jgi:hypothetical protein
MRSVITLLTVIVCLGIGACAANTGSRSPDSYGGGYGGGGYGGGSRY